jgi:glycosyltransferase involved in cell wall biosynthesis
MKICIVGPGIMPIPPTGWGAVEILIWDYIQHLEGQEHEVTLVNTRNKMDIINEVNSKEFDFVHIQYDDHIDIVPNLNCENVAITSHYGYLEQPNKYDGGYRNIFNNFLNISAKIIALSPGIKGEYVRNGKDPNDVFVVPNGVRNDLFSFEETIGNISASIYLAKIDYRKRQHLFQGIPNLYFAGNIADNRFDSTNRNYLGEWSKEHLYKNLTKFANLVLLSDGEAHPLVCLEAMSAGLGLVISEYSTANLDTSLPFIDVIPEDKISDIDYITEVIENNKIKSVGMRKEIRQYVLDNFDWEYIIKNIYVPTIEKMINDNNGK